MTFYGKLEDADGVELVPMLRVYMDEGPGEREGSFMLGTGKSKGVLRVLNDPGDPNYRYRLVATDGRSTTLCLLGNKSIGSAGDVEVRFRADGPLSEPPDDD